MGSYTGTVPTFLAGELPDGDKFIEVTNFMTADTSAWSAYTPVWASSGTQPVLNNGTLTGFYRQIGQTVNFRMTLLMGSTTTFGTGTYSITIPVATSLTGQVLPCNLNDASSIPNVAMAIINISTTMIFYGQGSAATSNTVPITWASGDQIVVCGTYEVA